MKTLQKSEKLQMVVIDAAYSSCYSYFSSFSFRHEANTLCKLVIAKKKKTITTILTKMMITTAIAAVIIALALTPSLLVGIQHAEAQSTNCLGLAITIPGTNGNNVLRGTSRADVIHGF